MAALIAFAVVGLAALGWGCVGLAQAAGRRRPRPPADLGPFLIGVTQVDDAEHPFSVLAAATVKHWDDNDELESEQHAGPDPRNVWHPGPRGGCALCVADDWRGINPSY